MAKLSWNKADEKYYEAGVDRGVLYPESGAGVPWNGLISVSETPTGGEAIANYLDGVKYHNEANSEEFEATIEAFTYPDEFSDIDGTGGGDRGLSYGEQARSPFGLSYRTKIGSASAGLDYGYKIHIIYNALTSPTQKNNSTSTLTPEVTTFSWNITATPEIIPARKPTAHLTINSTKTDSSILLQLENILYGSGRSTARLPSPDEVITLLDDWARLEIKPALTTGLVKLIYHGAPDLKGNSRLGIYKAPLGTRLTETSVLGLYSLEND